MATIHHAIHFTKHGIKSAIANFTFIFETKIYVTRIRTLVKHYILKGAIFVADMPDDVCGFQKVIPRPCSQLPQ